MDLGGCSSCSLTGLIDKTTRVMYALHGKILIKDDKNAVIGMSEAYLRLDYAKFLSEQP